MPVRKQKSIIVVVSDGTVYSTMLIGYVWKQVFGEGADTNMSHTFFAWIM